MRLLDPESVLLLHHLEAEARIRRINRYGSAHSGRNPLGQSVRQVWQRLVGSAGAQPVSPACCPCGPVTAG